jgi:hypothetical protein
MDEAIGMRRKRSMRMICGQIVQVVVVNGYDSEVKRLSARCKLDIGHDGDCIFT